MFSAVNEYALLCLGRQRAGKERERLRGRTQKLFIVSDYIIKSGQFFKI